MAPGAFNLAAAIASEQEPLVALCCVVLCCVTLMIGRTHIVIITLTMGIDIKGD